MKKILTLAFALVALASACSKKDPVPAPVANFSITGDNNFAPNKVTFTSNSSNAVLLNWDFGDGSSAVGEVVTHVYTTGKTYTVTLTANNSDGQKNIITKTATVKPLPTKMILNSVVLEQLPLVKPDGSAWDTGSGPDPYFKISDAAGTEYFKSKYFADVLASSFPLTYVGQGVPNTTAFPITFSALDFDYTLEIWDYNTITDNRMAIANFKIRTYMPTDGSPYPDKIKFTNTNTSLTINIAWQ